MARPRKTISRSPSGLVRCSDDPINSADNLIIKSQCNGASVCGLYRDHAVLVSALMFILSRDLVCTLV